MMKRAIIAALCMTALILPSNAAIDNARSLVEQGKLQEAYEAYLALVFQDPRNMDVNFELGMVALNIGIYEIAVNAFERILMVNPDLPRVRLELGRAYMLLENTLLARQNFQRVLEQQLPDQVRQNVEELLAQMARAEQKVFVSGRLTVGAIHDTNVNVFTFNNELRLAGGFTFQADGESYRKWGDMQALDMKVTHDFGEKGGYAIDYSAGATRIAYHGIPNGEDFNTNLISLGVTPLYAAKGSIFRLGFLFDEIHIAGERYGRFYGIAPEYLVPAGSQWMIAVRGIGQKRDVLNNDDQDSTFFSVEFAPRYSFAEGKMSVGFTLKAANNDAKTDENSYRATTIGIDGFASLPWELMFSGAYSYTGTAYDGQMLLAGGFPLFDEKRRDTQHQWRAGFSRSFGYGFTASLAYTYNMNRSNLDLFDYNRAQTMLTLTKEF